MSHHGSCSASRLTAAGLLAILLALPGFAQTSQTDQAMKQRIALFNYDAKAPFNLQTNSTENRGRVTIRDVSFAGLPGKTTVKAYLVTPEGKGPFAAILWAHWLGEAKSDRGEFLDEAVALAGKGCVSLLVDCLWADPDWYGNRVPESDYAASIGQVIELRRAMDLLLSQPGVDKTRAGFVGHDFGGMYGTIAMGLDGRSKTNVFMAVNPSLLNWAFFAKQPVSKVDYIRQNAVLDLGDFAAMLKGSSLFQFSKTDPYVSRADAAVIFAAAPKPKDRKFYDAGHDLQGDAILADRDAWLVKELGLTP